MKGGFTLIELLAVLVILAIVALIATPLVLDVLDKTKVNAYNAQVGVIVDATDKYLMTNIESDILKVGETKEIKLKELYNNNIIQKIKNPYIGEYFDENSIVYATRVNESKIKYYFEGSNDCRYNSKKCLSEKIKTDLVGKSQEYEGIFYKSLNRPEFLVDYDFCVGKQDPTVSSDMTCSAKLTDKVGLLSWWEYKIAGPNTNGDGSYLDIDDYLSLLTVDARDEHKILIINANGSIYDDDGITFASYTLDHRNTSISVRPVINLKSTISILDGDGTKEKPYRLVGDENGEEGDYLNSRHAGEYLNFAGKRYRIVSKNNGGNTKIVMDEYITSTGTIQGERYTYFDRGENENNICLEQVPYTYCNNRFDVTDGSGDYNGSLGHNIGYFLNSNASNSFYNSLGEYKEYLDYGTYYLGKWRTGRDYNFVYTNAYTNGYGVEQYKVGLLMYGEMLAGNNNESSTDSHTNFLISPYEGDAFITRVSAMGYIHLYYSGFPYFVVKPTLNLKPNVKIVSGDGTLNNPYEISL